MAFGLSGGSYKFKQRNSHSDYFEITSLAPKYELWKPSNKLPKVKLNLPMVFDLWVECDQKLVVDETQRNLLYHHHGSAATKNKNIKSKTSARKNRTKTEEAKV